MNSVNLLNQASLNRIWAKLILLSLHRQGVCHFCLAPGSRSTPLTLEVASLAAINEDIQIHTHFDERGLGFLALGLAKTTKQAVAVIVTSGTAVANLLPAVVESGLTCEKLILLSADRPQTLINCGANQAIAQQGIFSSHLSSECYLPSPTERISPKWLVATLSEQLAIQAKQGRSIHINCPYPEALYGGLEAEQQPLIEGYLKPVNAFLNSDGVYLKVVSPLDFDYASLSQAWQKWQRKKGLIIVGNTQASSDILALADKLGWPILSDPQSGASTNYKAYDLWLQNAKCQALLNECEFILQFGARLVSKRLGQFLSAFSGEYWLVDESASRLEPQHLALTQIQSPPSKVAAAFFEHCNSSLPWAQKLSIASKNTLKLAKNLCMRAPLSELGFAYDFANWLAKDSALFIGNSLVIRLLDMLSELPCCSVFANRGASGIDGLIATAVGVQRGVNQPMLCVLGDMSALYDLNSLALLSDCKQPFVIIIINNAGCGIFDLLPVPEMEKDKFYRLPHQLNFSHAAAMFDIDYHAPTSLMQAKALCLGAQQKPKASLIELKVSAGEAGEGLQQLFTLIRDAKLS